jgi:hypothetical protein
LLSQRRLLTELRLRETGREWKRIHPLRNDFGSNAVIAPVLRQSPEVGCFSASPSLCPHIPESFGESIRERIVVAGLAVIRPTASSEVAGEHARFKRS